MCTGASVRAFLDAAAAETRKSRAERRFGGLIRERRAAK
jgi:hypothetical protein